VEEGKGQEGLATCRQYGNALLGVRYQEEEESSGYSSMVLLFSCALFWSISVGEELFADDDRLVVSCRRVKLLTHSLVACVASSTRW